MTYSDPTLPRFGLVANVESPVCMDLARKAIDTLILEGLVMEPSLAQATSWEGPVAPLSDMEVEAIVTIGGDGTVLRTLCQARAPLFAINGGEVGFLTEGGPDELDEGLKRLFSRDHHVEEVQRLVPHLNSRPLEPAANEVVIHTAKLAKMLHLEVEVGEEQAQSFRADGLIVATPTGSTSYAMSAGGPLLHPQVQGVVVVPIAPFKLSARPLVVPSSLAVKVRLLLDKPAELVIDGHAHYDMNIDDTLLVEGAPNPGQMVRFGSRFYQRLQSKLNA